jgi:hypothetical protein
VKTIEDLRGKKVSFGPAGSASSLTGTIVFQRLGVKVEQVLVDNASALQKLKSGEIAALVRVIGKPIDFFAKIPASAGLHFVPIPFSKTFADYYTLGELRVAEAAPQVTSADFSNFLKSKGSAFVNLTQEQRDAIFLEFLRWQKQRSGAGVSQTVPPIAISPDRHQRAERRPKSVQVASQSPKDAASAAIYRGWPSSNLRSRISPSFTYWKPLRRPIGASFLISM